jgi:protein-S-isoprenylcysteine O-methyltransferase Ste14
MDIIIRLLVILLSIIRTLYWRIIQGKAESEKPKLNKRTPYIILQIVIRNSFNILFFLQLVGLDIFPFSQTNVGQLLGLFVCIVAVMFSILGRKELGTNWIDAAEYQIKKNHSLVTSGIYDQVRHPIYTGYVLFILGIELVVASWLVIPFAIFIPFLCYMQAKKEEAILVNKFAKEYIRYMKKTKMFLPYIF